MIQWESLDGTGLTETTSFHLGIAGPFVDAFVPRKCFSQRRTHKVSTTRLLDGDDAGDPADKKHLQISFVTIMINLVILYYTSTRNQCWCCELI